MAFSSSSIQLYHLDDPPTITTDSWPPLPPRPPRPPPPPHHHHHHHHQLNQQLPGRSGENVPGTELPPPLPPSSGHGGGGTGSVQPHSTAERARLAKIPQPEAGLNCPRCDSTNTKFCYFNNYNLSQPRHFCKACRRYWTRGGALRNVPVGGGCRRNKRAKGGRGRSKSPVTERAGAATPGLSNTTVIGTAAGDILGHLTTQVTQLPLFPPLHNLNEYAPLDIRAGIGLDFQVGSGDHSQWRMHQMPQIPSFFANTLEGQGIGQHLSNNKTLYSSPSAMVDPTTTVKSEGLSHIRDLNLSSMNFTSINEQYTTWVGNANWSDLSGGFSSAPTGHLL